MPSLAEIVDYLNHFAPPTSAATWDNVGLLIGDRSVIVERIVTCLTVTPPVVDEAIALKANLIVSHHPMLFRPVQKITDVNVEGRMLLALLRHGIAVHSPHTAFDNCAGGINEMLARRLELNDIAPLRFSESSPQCKVVVFVPDSDLTRVSDAMFAQGAGTIGQYRECSFRMAGTGTFFGNEASNPRIGEKGRREEVGESRLEVTCPESSVDGVIAAMRAAHSYEEPAFDVYRLRPGRGPLGTGRRGRLASPTSLEEFARHVREVLNAGPTQIVGNNKTQIQTIALACGAAGEFLADAVRMKADVFVTGEMRFHDYLAAQAQQVALVLPGHYATERFAIEELAVQLSTHFPTVTVGASQCETDPSRWV